MDADTEFTLACDTVNDGNDTLDTSSSTNVTVTDLTACPYREESNGGEYDEVVQFGGETLYGAIERGASSLGQSVTPQDAQTTEKNLTLSPGQYAVDLFAFDDSRGLDDHDRTDNPQPKERLFARFWKNSGNYEVVSSSTDDLPDANQLGTTSENTTLQINQATQNVELRHHGYYKDDSEIYPNSLNARCIGIDEQQGGPTTNLTAGTNTIPYNGSTTLDWSFSNVSSGTTTSDTGNVQWANTNVFPPTQTCQAVGDGLCNGSNSTTIDNLTQDTEFTVTFDGTYGGTASDSTQVNVQDKPTDLNVDLSTVDPGASTTLSWSTTGMDNCSASSNPTHPDWTVGINPDPAGGTTTINNLVQTTDFTLTCEDTSEGTTLSDSVTVTVKGVELSIEPQDIWGVQLSGSITTQSKITLDGTNFSDDIDLSVSPVGGAGIGANLQFVNSQGNIVTNPQLSPLQFDDGIWLRAQIGSNTQPGETTLQVTADAVNSTSSASETLEMHIRSIGER